MTSSRSQRHKMISERSKWMIYEGEHHKGKAILIQNKTRDGHSKSKTSTDALINRFPHNSKWVMVTSSCCYLRNGCISTPNRKNIQQETDNRSRKVRAELCSHKNRCQKYQPGSSVIKNQLPNQTHPFFLMEHGGKHFIFRRIRNLSLT